MKSLSKELLGITEEFFITPGEFLSVVHEAFATCQVTREPGLSLSHDAGTLRVRDFRQAFGRILPGRLSHQLRFSPHENGKGGYFEYESFE